MIENPQEQFRVDVRRRLLLLGGASGLLLVGLGVRLFYLQVLKGGHYRDMANDNRISLHPIPAPRGRIFDRFGVPLVENNPDYVLAVIPELAGDLAQLLSRLQTYTSLSDKTIEVVLRQSRRQRAFLPLKVKSHLTWEELSGIEVHLPSFPGVIIQTRSQRVYPYGVLGAHLLGYLGEVTDIDREQFTQIRFRYGDLVGKNGVERSYEELLRGVEGVRELEINAFGRQVRELHQSAAQPGQDLYLTIDLALQRSCEELFQGQTGAVVVLDVNSFEVLAMVSYPAYDPNEFIRGFTAKQWYVLLNNPGRPLSNKAIQGQYPPGSTFKMVVALAALQEGRITPQDRFFCPGYLMRESQRFNCWRRVGHGSVNLEEAIEQSCDVYFYRLGEKLGIDIIEKYARLFGFGESSGVGLHGERHGLVPSRTWKRKTRKEAIWYPGENLITAIGQGYLTATPLQLACMTAAIANGGTLYRPSMIRNNAVTPVIRQPVFVRREHINIIKQCMELVVNGEHGTGRAAKPAEVRVAGKTGTSQVVRQQRHDDRSDERRFRDHALFVAYAPADRPEIALAIVVEHGGHGGQTAAPIAGKIIDRYFERQRLQQGRGVDHVL
ncbi:MAG: penicillin-binding protein 2 [Magnetococcales bacterium]|nr:penicillin-binding protein 2 [Magnetococcales bacterium]